MSEIWKTVEKFSLLRVSNLGNIMAVNGPQPRVFANKQGHLTIAVAHNCYLNIHRAVADAFLVKPDRTFVLSHIDGDRLNNRATNLQYSPRGKTAEEKRNTHMWRDVRGFEGRYQVSRDGQIKSLPRDITIPDGSHRYVVGCTRKLLVSSEGYAVVSFGKIYRRVHTLVANAFIPAEPGKILVHLNSNNLDNRVSNLKYMTRGEAYAHKNPPKKLFRRRKRGTSAAQEGASV